MDSQYENSKPTGNLGKNMLSRILEKKETGGRIGKKEKLYELFNESLHNEIVRGYRLQWLGNLLKMRNNLKRNQMRSQEETV